MIAIGDKVVCVDEKEYTPVERRGLVLHPGGKVIRGNVYTVAFLFVTPSGNLKVGIVGLPVIQKATGEDIGWRSKRFRKLEEYRAGQELAYYRSLPGVRVQGSDGAVASARRRCPSGCLRQAISLRSVASSSELEACFEGRSHS